MTSTPDTWSALLGFVLLLGVRHGIDADHLAAVDGLARLNAARSPRLARCCGLLFAGGHAAMVMAVVATVAATGQLLHPPAWLANLGVAASIALLLALAAANLAALLRAPADQGVALVGLKTLWMARWLAPWMRMGSAWSVLTVGALVALSLDTLSLAAWMALSGSPQGGTAAALTLAACFATGMLAADGLHGWWLASVLGRDDARAARVSRWLCACVAASSLVVAAVAALRWWNPASTAGTEGQGVLLATLVIVGTGLVYLAARLLPMPASAGTCSAATPLP